MPSPAVADRDEVGARLRKLAYHRGGRFLCHVLDGTGHRGRPTVEDEALAAHHCACGVVNRDGRLSTGFDGPAGRIDQHDVRSVVSAVVRPATVSSSSPAENTVGLDMRAGSVNGAMADVNIDIWV
jgi:hypothetical protein